MDCAAEEQLVRMKLEPFDQVKGLSFDLEQRQLTVYHEHAVDPVEKALGQLGLGAVRMTTGPYRGQRDGDAVQEERRLLWMVFAINAAFFVIEIVAGFVSESMGLMADSLDMLADALVYGMSLYAVGKAVTTKKNVARASGYLQVVLAVTGFFEVMRRFFFGDDIPDYLMMVTVSAFALTANAVCLYLLTKAKSTEAHIRASVIFTSNDVIINSGVMIAGGLVYLTGSNVPDLIVGTIVFLIVLRGAWRILALSR